MRKFIFPILSVFFSLTLISCGSTQYGDGNGTAGNAETSGGTNTTDTGNNGNSSCPQSPAPGFENGAHSALINDCAGCHGSTYTTFSSASAHASSISSRVSSGNMPPGGAINSSDKAAILDWISCGKNP